MMSHLAFLRNSRTCCMVTLNLKKKNGKYPLESKLLTPTTFSSRKKKHTIYALTKFFVLLCVQFNVVTTKTETKQIKKFDVFNLHSINRFQAPGVEREAFLSKQKHICAQPEISSLQLGATTDCTIKSNIIVMYAHTTTIFQSFVIF